MGSKRKAEAIAEELEDDVPSLNIRVISQVTATPEIFFKIKINCRLYKLLKNFCENQNVDYKSTVFLYEGKRILPKYTPKSLNMKDNDEIIATTNAGGGGAF